MKLLPRFARFACLCLAVLPVTAHAQTDYNSEILYPTSNGPYGNPIQASDGNIYIAGSAEILRLTPPVPGFTTAGTTAVIHVPSGNPDDGGYYENIIEGTDGNLYGVSVHGGAHGEGSIFKLAHDGTYSNLYSFCPAISPCPDGAVPTSIIQGADGDFYGTTTLGGLSNVGTVFKLSLHGTITTLYSFCPTENCVDGAYPTSGLIQATDGNFYGVTSASGNEAASPAGIIYQITPAGNFSVVYDLNVCAANNPNTDCNLTVQSTSGPLTEGGDGKLYGLVSGLPASPQTSSIYSLAFSLSLSGSFTPVASFCYNSDGYPCGTNSVFGNAAGPMLPFFPAANKNLFLANSSGGIGGGSFIGFYPGSDSPFTYYDFCDCGDGYSPTGAVIQANDGSFYGTLSDGIYNISLVGGSLAPISITTPSTNLLVGQTAKLSWTVNNPTSDTLKQCIGWLDGNRIGPAPLSGSYDYTPTTAGTHLVSLTCGGTETGLLRLFVADSQASTTTTLSVNPASAPTGTAYIPIVVGVTKQNGVPGIASGTVTIKADGRALVTVPLNAYGYFVYQASTANIASGTYNLTATYNGDHGDTASTSAVVPFTVTAATSITSLAVNPDPVPADQPVQLVATVEPYSAPADPAPSGFVTFTYQNVTLGKVAVTPILNTGRSSATLTYSDKGIPAGNYNVTVNYSGDAFYSPSSTFGTVTIQ